MRKINFKKIILENILLSEAPPSPGATIDWSAKQLFESTTGKPNPVLTSGYLPYEFKNTYQAKFGIWPDTSILEQMTNVMDATVVSRGGAKQYEQYASYFPLLDLMFVVIQSNALGSGDFKMPGKLKKDEFLPSSTYGKWINQLNSTPNNFYPLDWIPRSAKGTEVVRQLSKDQFSKYASQLTLDTYKTDSILKTITGLLEVRKEARWSLVSRVKTSFSKNKEQKMPKEILDIFSNPQNYSGGVKAFPATIKNRYDGQGGLESEIFNLALSCDKFYKSEKQTYTPDLGPMEGTKLIELLENRVEAGSVDSLFQFIKPDGTTVPATQIGKNGYTIGNLKEYAQKNKAGEALWDQLEHFANYTRTDTWSWSQILGGAKRITGAISGMAGSFGK